MIHGALFNDLFIPNYKGDNYYPYVTCCILICSGFLPAMIQLLIFAVLSFMCRGTE